MCLCLYVCCALRQPICLFSGHLLLAGHNLYCNRDLPIDMSDDRWTVSAINFWWFWSVADEMRSPALHSKLGMNQIKSFLGEHTRCTRSPNIPLFSVAIFFFSHLLFVISVIIFICVWCAIVAVATVNAECLWDDVAEIQEKTPNCTDTHNYTTNMIFLFFFFSSKFSLIATMPRNRTKHKLNPKIAVYIDFRFRVIFAQRKEITF